MELDIHKICFIACVNNEAQYAESVLYIQNLAVPTGMSIELMPIRGASSLTAGYQQGMLASDAKYKVYMHQDLFLVHHFLLQEMIDIFVAHPEIGAMGLAGSADLPQDHPVWWNGQHKLGSCYQKFWDEHIQLDVFGQVEAPYELAAGLDGIFIATQYDLPWRQDLLPGWHFYDIAQTREFIDAGYQVVVPYQAEPWCVHTCKREGQDPKYLTNMQTFQQHYPCADVSYVPYSTRGEDEKRRREEGAPLVSIMIPTYNRPELFERTLQSALAQTYPYVEILINDNSTNEITADLMKKYLTDARIRYFRNKQATCKADNFLPFARLARGEYLQWCMDDDILAPDKLEKMAAVLVRNPQVRLVSSQRGFIDAEDRIIDCDASVNIVPEGDISQGYQGRAVIEYMLSNCSNIIGEPSAVLFRRCDLRHHYWQADCRGYKTISDVAMWLELLEKGDLVLFREPLSFYRRHEAQEGQRAEIVLLSRMEWVQLLQEYVSRGILSVEDCQSGLQCLLEDYEEKRLMEYYRQAENYDTYVAYMEAIREMMPA